MRTWVDLRFLHITILKSAQPCSRKAKTVPGSHSYLVPKNPFNTLKNFRTLQNLLCCAVPAQGYTSVSTHFGRLFSLSIPGHPTGVFGVLFVTGMLATSYSIVNMVRVRHVMLCRRLRRLLYRLFMYAVGQSKGVTGNRATIQQEPSPIITSQLKQ